MKKIIILLLAAIPFISCNKDEYAQWWDELIDVYVKTDTIMLAPYVNTSNNAVPYDVVELQVYGWEGMKNKTNSIIHNYDIKACRIIYEYPISPIGIIFDSLKEAHRDIGLKVKNIYRDGWSVGTPFERNIPTPSLYHRHVSLDITADTDYDAAHPAGTKLNDIATVTFYCIDEIADADDFSALAGKRLDLSKRDFMHTEPLEVFNDRKRKFMAYNFTIKLTSPPAATGTFKFTVDYLNESGVPLSVTSDAITVKPEP